jgi:hypothetical protein
MIQSWIRRMAKIKGKSRSIQDLFRKYVRSHRVFVDIAEQRAIVLMPEQESAWRVMFGLQRLLAERQLLRFEYLVNRDEAARPDWTKLSDVESRIEGGWSEVEEGELAHASRHYAKLSESIRMFRSKLNAENLDAQLKFLQEDSHYRRARFDLGDNARMVGKEFDLALGKGK